MGGGRERELKRKVVTVMASQVKRRAAHSLSPAELLYSSIYSPASVKMQWTTLFLCRKHVNVDWNWSNSGLRQLLKKSSIDLLLIIPQKIETAVLRLFFSLDDKTKIIYILYLAINLTQIQNEEICCCIYTSFI